jgi:hypothetical protein
VSYGATGDARADGALRPGTAPRTRRSSARSTEKQFAGPTGDPAKYRTKEVRPVTDVITLVVLLIVLLVVVHRVTRQ